MPIRSWCAAWSAAIKLTAVFLAITWLCLPAGADFPKLITLTTDADNVYNYISPGGASQPVIWMILCAVVYINSDPAPGETVTFSADPGQGYVFSATSAATNGNGQAIVQARPVFGTIPATITARWLSGGHTFTAQVPITPATNDCQTLHDSSANKPTLPNPCAIPTYYLPYNNATRFAAEAQTAEANWHSFTAAPRVNFIGGTFQDYVIEYTDFCNSLDDGTFAQSERSESHLSSLTSFNIFYLDGNPNDIDCPSGYPPRSSQHPVVLVATHEIGHDLLFGHNDWDIVSLMWEDVRSYFMCGTQAPTPDETSWFTKLYPPCP